MKKLIGAGGLGAIALFMLLGFLNSDASLGSLATIVALLLTVGLPAAGAAMLVRSHYADRSRVTGRKAELRQQTLEAEILDLARAESGRLTAMEVATRLAITAESAKEALDSLTTRGHADLAVTDEGVLVYTFYDVRHIGGKSSAKGVLE